MLIGSHEIEFLCLFLLSPSPVDRWTASCTVSGTKWTHNQPGQPVVKDRFVARKEDNFFRAFFYTMSGLQIPLLELCRRCSGSTFQRLAGVMRRHLELIRFPCGSVSLGLCVCVCVLACSVVKGMGEGSFQCIPLPVAQN